MVSKKHGKIVSYETVLFEETTNTKVQIAQYEKGSSAVNLVKFITPNNRKQGLLVIPLSYNVIKTYIKELVKIEKDGKEKVERELGVKIQ